MKRLKGKEKSPAAYMQGIEKVCSYHDYSRNAGMVIGDDQARDRTDVEGLSLDDS